MARETKAHNDPLNPDSTVIESALRAEDLKIAAASRHRLVDLIPTAHRGDGSAFLMLYTHPFLLQLADLEARRSGPRSLLPTLSGSIPISGGAEDFLACPLYFLEARFSPAARPGASRIALGRDAANDVIIDHPIISRKHAVFEERGASWELRDRGSRNGTFLDGVPLDPEAPARLQDMSELDFGRRFSFLFLLPATLLQFLKETSLERLPRGTGIDPP